MTAGPNHERLRLNDYIRGRETVMDIGGKNYKVQDYTPPIRFDAVVHMLSVGLGGGGEKAVIRMFRSGIVDPAGGNSLCLGEVKIENEIGLMGVYKIRFQAKYVQRAMRLCALKSIHITKDTQAEFFYGITREVIAHMTLA